MKHRILTIILLLTPLLCVAGVPHEANRNQVRIGWGDMLFETLSFHPTSNLQGVVTSDYGYTGHIFGEYQRRLGKTLSVGAQLGFEGIFWKEKGAQVNNFNLALMPTVRFIYYEKGLFTLYSSLGAGLLTAFDNGGTVEFAPAFNLNFFSVQVGKGAWSGTLELGMLNALQNPNKVYMVASRMLSVSLNYAF